jgi:putative nucleotidyltransferase with HDIG domain
MDDTFQSHYVSVDQLCVGVYVQLEIGWIKHPFPRNSFKIKNEQQLATLKQLKIRTIRIDAALSDCAPLPLPEVDPDAVADDEGGAAEGPSEEEVALVEAKKERIDRVKEQRAAVGQCERLFFAAANTLKDLSRNIFARPKEAKEDAVKLVDQMLGSLLLNKDVAVHLMNDKGGKESYFHSLNVAVLAMMLAKELKMSSQDVQHIGMGSLFHDIGKQEIPSQIVNKTEPLSRPEMTILQQHCAYGEVLAKKITLPQPVIDIILQHHEFMDGSGYPNMLRGSQISPLARVVAIVNAYDNHCHHPNHNESLSPAEALAYMFKNQSKQFDSVPLQVFIRAMGLYPAGTIVRLSDDTLGMVVSANAKSPLRPNIMIYDASVPKNEAIIIDLQTETDIKVSESLKPAQLSREVYDYLSRRA